MFSAFEYFKFFRCTRISSTQYYSEQYASSKHWAFIETRLDMNICEFSHLNFKSSPISSWFRCLCFLGACSVWYNGQFDWITYCVKLEHWLHNYHKHHNRQWHVFLKPGTFFPQRMKKERNVYTEHVNTNLHFLCVMEIPDTHTKYQMYKKAKDTNHDKKTPCMAMKTICTPSKTTKIPSIPTNNQNTKYAYQNKSTSTKTPMWICNPTYKFTLLCCKTIFIANLCTFWHTFYRSKMRYVLILASFLGRTVQALVPCNSTSFNPIY